jgi:hypothetical protein
MNKTNKIKRFKWVSIILKMIPFLFIVVIGLFIFILLNAEKIINNNLSDYVYQKTDSIYRLEFTDIDINYKEKSLAFSNVALKPDKQLIATSSDKFYEFETNSLVISGIRVGQLLKSKIFSAVSIKANNPIFRLSTGQDVDVDMLTAPKIEAGDTIKLPYLNGISIDTILVTDARMRIDTLLTPGRKVPKVNLEILNFKVGGPKKTNTPFPFDVADISLKIENVQERLSDHIHQLSVNELSLSLLHSRITAKNILLKPYSDSLITNENQYNIEVPEIEIISPNVETFYISDTISIEKLTFQSPAIEIKFGKKIRKGTPLNQINLYKLIENELDWISINQFSIVDASLKLIPSKSVKATQELEDLDINFFDFRIDPTSYQDRNRVLSAKELDISIGKYALNHEDKVHQLVINNFKIDTKSKLAITGKITFKPVNMESKLISAVDALVDIQCEGAELKEIKFGEIYHRQILPMNELIINSPEVLVSLGKVKQKNKKENEISLLYQKTKDYMKGIYVQKTVINKGKLNYNYISDNDKTGFFMTNFKFKLYNLSVDSATLYQTEKIFFADDFEVKFSDIGLQLADDFHRLVTDSLKLSSKGKAAEVYNLRILPIKTVGSFDSLLAKGQYQVFDISFPKIELFDADLHKAFFEKELSITDFNVINPSINVDILGKINIEKRKNNSYKNEIYSLISDYLFSIRIEKLRMKNGQLNISQHRKGQSPVELSNAFSVEMTRFEIDSLSPARSKKIFFSDDVDLVLKDYSFALADGVHKIDADEIGVISSESKIYVKGAKLFPDVSATNFHRLSLTAFATLPLIQVNGADIHGLFNTGQFSVNSIEINKPVIKLLFHGDSIQKTEKVQKPQFTLKDFNLLTAGRISINEGSIELSNYNRQKSKTFATSTIDFTLNNLRVEHDQTDFKTSYNDYNLSLKNTNIIIPEGLQQLDIKQATYRFPDKSLKISNLSFKPGQTDLTLQSKSSFSFLLPTLLLSDFDLMRFVEKKEIVLSKLLVTSPYVEIEEKKQKENSKFDPFKLQLFNNIKGFISKIEVGKFGISDASIMLIGNKTKRFDRLTLSGNSFMVDKNSEKLNRFLSCESVRFETSDLKGKTKDGFYNYSVSQLGVTSNGEFEATGISLIPAYSEAEFNRRKVYQDDYINIYNANCHGKGFDLKRLFEKDQVAISNASIVFDKVEIYRNNHFPIPPGLKLEMPQKELRDLKAKFIADSISISCGRFNYRELEPQATSETRLFFTDLNASITHLTNIEEILRKDPYAHLNIDTKLMGEGKMRAKINLNTLSPDNKFDLVAECGPMPMNLLNSVTEPSLKLSIKEGKNDKMTMYFEANEDSAKGQMSFAYSNLKITLLSEKDGTIKEEKFISFLLNSLAVKGDNPRPGKILVPVQTFSFRDKQRSFINYCWKSAFSGIKNTFGLKEDEPQEKIH